MEWQQILDFINHNLRSNGALDEIKSKEKKEDVIMSCILSQIEIREFLLTWLNKLPKNKRSKCPIKAKHYKKQANKAYKIKNYQESVQLYTKCIQYAPSKSEDFLQAITYRSASLFHLEKYEESIKDIELIVKWQCSPNINFKLHRQAAESFLKLNQKESMIKHLLKAKEYLQNCDDKSKQEKEDITKTIESRISDASKINTSQLNQSSVTKSKPEPAYGENALFTSASAALCKKNALDKGRYVITNRDIKKGQILFVEKPFAFVLLDHERIDSFCDYCCCPQFYTPIPCSGCSNIMYCNMNCQTKAWDNYHQWECPGNRIDLWRQIGIAHLALNVFLTCTTTSNIDRFNQVQSLITNIDKILPDDLLVYSITATMLTVYLRTYTDFFKVIDLEKHFVRKFNCMDLNFDCDLSTDNAKEVYVSAMLLRCTLQMICNGHAITGLSYSDFGANNIQIEQQDRIATAIYPSASMMNHSCDTNIINSFWDQHLIIKAIKDIPAGEEVFNCYGPHFRRMSTKERQENLKSQYCFTCKCDPCTNPELQHFTDRFTALKCPNCNGALYQDSSKCLDCGTTSVIEYKSNLKEAEHLFESAQVSLEVNKMEEALNKSKRCLHIRKIVFYKYHEDIACTLDLIGKIYAVTGQYLESIKYLEESLETVKDRFGNDSIEVAVELNKLTDVYIQYLYNENDNNAVQNMARKALLILDHAKQIMDLNNGPWTSGYQEILEKKNELLLLLQFRNLKL